MWLYYVWFTIPILNDDTPGEWLTLFAFQCIQTSDPELYTIQPCYSENNAYLSFGNIHQYTEAMECQKKIHIHYVEWQTNPKVLIAPSVTLDFI